MQFSTPRPARLPGAAPGGIHLRRVRGEAPARGAVGEPAALARQLRHQRLSALGRHRRPELRLPRVQRVRP
jgi:hypothetical protein